MRRDRSWRFQQAPPPRSPATLLPQEHSTQPQYAANVLRTALQFEYCRCLHWRHWLHICTWEGSKNPVPRCFELAALCARAATQHPCSCAQVQLDRTYNKLRRYCCFGIHQVVYHLLQAMPARANEDGARISCSPAWLRVLATGSDCAPTTGHRRPVRL